MIRHAPVPLLCSPVAPDDHARRTKPDPVMASAEFRHRPLGRSTEDEDQRTRAEAHLAHQGRVGVPEACVCSHAMHHRGARLPGWSRFAGRGCDAESVMPRRSHWGRPRWLRPAAGHPVRHHQCGSRCQQVRSTRDDGQRLGLGDGVRLDLVYRSRRCDRLGRAPAHRAWRGAAGAASSGEPSAREYLARRGSARGELSGQRCFRCGVAFLRRRTSRANHQLTPERTAAASCACGMSPSIKRELQAEHLACHYPGRYEAGHP